MAQGVIGYDAIVLAGGGSLRLGGVSKARIVVRGKSLLEHAIDAATGAATTVVVGPQTAHHPAQLTTSETPPGGGPVAGIAAGLSLLTPGELWVLVLACDAPSAAHAVPVLVSAASTSPAQAVIAMDGGRLQPLLACYRRAALDAALDGMEARGASMRDLMARLTIAEVAVPDGAASDLDTWDDVRQALSATDSRSEAHMAQTELEQWLATLGSALGAAPNDVSVETLLDAARDAAHGVTRPAAPLATFMVGYAVASGMPLDEACRTVSQVARDWRPAATT
jgi:molybdopterin-guanine dinucleotide biosynthesis protein A